MTDPPNFKAGETETKVKVPALAANSEVGFTDTLGNIDEGKNQLAVRFKTTYFFILKKGHRKYSHLTFDRDGNSHFDTNSPGTVWNHSCPMEQWVSLWWQTRVLH